MILKGRSKDVFELQLDQNELLMLAFALGWASGGPAGDDDAKFRQRFGWKASGPPPSKQELISMREVACNCIDLLHSAG